MSVDIKQNYEMLYDTYGAKLYRTLLAYLKNAQDAEDVLQNTFYKLYICEKPFETEEHVKNWLFLVGINEAKNVQKSRWKFFCELDETLVSPETQEDGYLLEEIMKLPEKYRMALILHYYDGYSVAEIAKLLNRKESTILTHLQRGREKLGKNLKGGNHEELFI